MLLIFNGKYGIINIELKKERIFMDTFDIFTHIDEIEENIIPDDVWIEFLES